MLFVKTLLFITLSAACVHSAAAQESVDRLPSQPAAERTVAKPAGATEAALMVAPPAPKKAAKAADAGGEAIVKTALQYLGARYRSGQSGPSAFDCSGFTSYVYGKKSISLTRSSRTQYNEGTPVARIGDLQKGDLVFFGGSGASRTVGHVGIVTEVDPSGTKFKFVHAARTGVQVDDSSSAYYSRRYIGARRILQE